ncbi:MAG: L-aspartate oxidase [Verrucomicrobiota bacterium]|jgi:L-aspartate oxidase|nr:L-aspartate oxidase [Verrucomicrobiota bacterium]
MNVLDCDYLVIGSGLAGLSAVLELTRHGRTILCAKRELEESNSSNAQGGIAVPIAEEDTIESHVHDTLVAGAGLTREDIAREIIAGGAERIAALEKWGVRFERKSCHPRETDAEYDLGREGGHSVRRILHSGDITGAEIIRALVERTRRRKNLAIMENVMAIDLITTGWLKVPDDNACLGAYFLDRKTGEILAVRARHTMLATGGAGKVYLYTSNPDTATGDGLAMAWRAGLPIRNMEFVQFHPTCLYHPEAKSFLISEAVRGEGGRLLNAAGKAFMKRYDPRAELAPRDIVARAIDHEMKSRGDACVYLDITQKSEAFLKHRFPNIFATCKKFGINMAKQPIPVVPAAHYFCGGVEADVRGRTAMPGLHAAGEVTCTGLHGANRLASNSLLEALVCGHAAAMDILENPRSSVRRIKIPAWKTSDAVPSDEAVVVSHNWNEVRTVMWDYVGIVRTNRRLARALRRIKTLRREIRAYYRDYIITDDLLELRNIAAVAELVIRSASIRLESRGLHYTLDYPHTARSMAQDTILHDLPGGSTV